MFAYCFSILGSYSALLSRSMTTCIWLQRWCQDSHRDRQNVKSKFSSNCI